VYRQFGKYSGNRVSPRDFYGRERGKGTDSERGEKKESNLLRHVAQPNLALLGRMIYCPPPSRSSAFNPRYFDERATHPYQTLFTLPRCLSENYNQLYSRLSFLILPAIDAIEPSRHFIDETRIQENNEAQVFASNYRYISKK